MLHKSLDISELFAAVRVAAAGGSVLPPEPTSRQLRALAESRERGWQARAVGSTITAREREVLQLLVEGTDGRGIARELHISPQTVHTHIRNLLTKLDAASRLEGVAKALRLGLVDPPS